jgi:hypothetical protein
MRPWICTLVLGAGLTLASTLPAAADHMPRQPSHLAVNGHHQTFFPRHGFFHHHPLLSSLASGGLAVIPGDYFDGGFPSGMPLVIVPSSAPAVAQLPPRSAVEERPSVESTEEGVVIVRGPGSRHLGY